MIVRCNIGDHFVYVYSLFLIVRKVISDC